MTSWKSALVLMGAAVVAAAFVGESTAADDLAALRARYEREKGQPYAVRSHVLTEASNLGTDAAVRFLIGIIDGDTEQSMRSNGVFWMGRIKRPSAWRALLKYYREGPETLRHTALNAMAGRTEAMPKDIMDGALASTSSGTRSTIIRKLGIDKDPRFIAEAKRFLAEFPTSSSSMISCLVSAKSPEAARLLIRIYDDSRKNDRTAVPGMFANGSDELRAVLLAVLTGRVSVEEFLNAAIIVGRAKVTEAEGAIVDAIPGASEERRVILIETIGVLGGTTVEGRIAIRDALADKSDEVRAAGVRALRGAPDRLAIATLIGLLAKSKGLLAIEVRITLERITGHQYGERVDLWEQWWATEGEAFRLEDVRKRDPLDLDQAMIDLAIEKGVRALRRIRGEESPWNYANHPVGTTALVVLALHASGASRKDRDVKAALKYIVGEPVPQKTYECGLVAMALEVVNARRYKRHIGACAKRLISTQLADGMWGYPTGDGDNSNTQYAVLGLRSAARADIKIPKRVWKAIRQHFLRTKAYEGGWSYRKPVGKQTGCSASMTAAAVTCLLICLENEGLKIGNPEDRALREAIDSGFTALGKIMKLDTDALYALYGIERSGILGRRAVMADKPWYAPGAKRLLDEQGRDGFWRAGYNEAVQTAFAILFLKKATAPITGK
jgi:hypothetical protein